MKYMGSKSKIAKFIVPILQKEIDDNNITTYIEPFVGGANVIDKIHCKNLVAYDNNKYLIALYNNLDKIENLPSEINKDHYSDVRDCFNKKGNTYEDWYMGAVGFLSSYNGRFFDGGYSGSRVIVNGSVRNYYDEARRNLIKQSQNLKGIDFQYSDFRDLKSFHNCLIYCDPPYKNTKKYGTSKNFNYDDFWEWCRINSKDNIVIISEQEAPEDFECIWTQNINRTIDNNSTKKSCECLFIQHRSNRY